MQAQADMTKSVRIELRARVAQVAEIDRAAEIVHKNRTDFMLDSAGRESQRILADRRLFTLGDTQRDEFLALLDRPPVPKPRLRALFERGSVLPDA